MEQLQKLIKKKKEEKKYVFSCRNLQRKEIK